MLRHPPAIVLNALVVADVAVHSSNPVMAYPYQEKQVAFFITLSLGAPGNLSYWIEVSQDTTVANFVVLGVPGIAVATINIPVFWVAHSMWARVSVQAVAPCNALNFWTVTAVYTAGGEK